ncbi:protein YAE1 homolog [Sphaerodactylus townsendi]|uniref:protein YAE1 homolog n=1 Tax=Sphaerodactylus townsendi TaxID=933632 RepID=UPI0020265044|nr:protein YAE1 homolog [Sphaerodactylus townsendi]XP_048367536.1 protein YAE1 homolog [Sphaerodactylus townsendi]XP_048367538.1 protein YAE1 homolog [Sphaerodactylus townsendi]
MSWVQSAVSQANEDVFDEDADEMGIAQKEWKSAMEKRVKEGYREGVEAGKELTLQKGFNEGYEEAAKIMFSCGQLKGNVSALLSWCHKSPCDSAVLNTVTDLLNDINKYEEATIKDLSCTHPQSSLADLMDTVEDMDLGHEPSPEEQANGIVEPPTGLNGTQFCGCHCTNGGTDPPKSECCRRQRNHTAGVKPTLPWLKERTVNLMEQLGLSPSTLAHI